MKYQDFSSDKNLVSSEDMIFIFHTVKISLPDFLDKLLTHFKDIMAHRFNKILYALLLKHSEYR